MASLSPSAVLFVQQRIAASPSWRPVYRKSLEKYLLPANGGPIRRMFSPLRTPPVSFESSGSQPVLALSADI